MITPGCTTLTCQTTSDPTSIHSAEPDPTPPRPALPDPAPPFLGAFGIATDNGAVQSAVDSVGFGPSGIAESAASGAFGHSADTHAATSAESGSEGEGVGGDETHPHRRSTSIGSREHARMGGGAALDAFGVGASAFGNASAFGINGVDHPPFARHTSLDQRHHYTTAPLHHYTTAPLHYCSTTLLHHCTTAPLHYCSTAPLH